MLESLLPRNRIKALTALLDNPSNSYYLREFARISGIPLRAAQRELAIYEGMRLVTRIPRGKQVFFVVETRHPFFAELRALVLMDSHPAEVAAIPPSTTFSEDSRVGTVSAMPSETAARRRASWRVW